MSNLYHYVSNALFIITDISNSRKKMLPPYLFERILLKSKETRWYIQLDNLRDMLPYRDILNWKNIDLLPFTKHITTLDESILDQMSRVVYPLDSFSIYVVILTNEGIRNLCAMGSTIKSLELCYGWRLYIFLTSIYI